MKLILKNFSQDVDFLNPENTTNYLVFVEEDTAQTFRLPVPRETIMELVKMVHGGAAELDPAPEEPKEAAPESYPEDAEVFGDDEEEEAESFTPESEEQVPSI